MLKLPTGELARIKKLPRGLMVILLLVYIISLYRILIPQRAVGRDYVEHVVQSGETLWGISKHYNPSADPRETVYEIQKSNNCTPMIVPGQVIQVPEGRE